MSIPHSLRGRLSVLVGWVALLAAPLSATAENPKFGVARILAIDDGTWNGLSTLEKKGHIDRRLDLARQMGATVVRLADGTPRLFAQDMLKKDTGRDWTLVDHLISSAQDRGIELCVTFPDMIPDGQTSEYSSHLTKVLERYDGDANFGVATQDRNKEYPDVDETGSVTFADWTAPDEVKLEWANRHRLGLIESGDRPKVHEDAGLIGTGDYALQLKAAWGALQTAASDAKLMLATTALDDQAAVHFEARLADLGDSKVFQIASAALQASLGDLTGDKAVANLRKFPEWLANVGHPDSERWLGSLVVGDTAICKDPRCSERTKSALLAKVVVHAILEGYSTIVYGWPLEGADGELGAPQGASLLSVKKESADQASYSMRPSFAVWRWLTEHLGALDSTAIVPVVGLLGNVHGVKVGDAGWLFWYDWTREVAPGQPIGGKEKEIVLEDLSSTALDLTTLWQDVPAQSDQTLSLDELVWPLQTVDVVDGRAAFRISEDLIWVTVAEATHQGDLDPVADASGDDLAVEPAAPPPNEDGCASQRTSPPPGWLSIMVLLLFARARARRAWKRAACRSRP